MNLPNKLTMLRILLIPVFMVFVEWDSLPGHILWAFVIFVAASLTDFVDGYIARKNNMVTDFGKFMDPLADKILVTAALVYFIPLGLAPAWVVILILAREFLVTSLRLIAAGKGIVIAADKWGKYKTAVTMITIIFMIPNFGGAAVHMIEQIMIYLSLALTVISLIDYLIHNKSVLAGKM